MSRLTHGMSNTPEYYSWKAMKERCTNKHHKAYKHYGGRGLVICNRWLNSFENFYADMGDRPNGLSLERTNNNKGYNPKNCKWDTGLRQNRNRNFKRNSSGVTGVIFRKKRKIFEAYLSKKYLGMFPTLLDAICARKSAQNKCWN